jgi:hypothetical protein
MSSILLALLEAGRTQAHESAPDCLGRYEDLVRGMKKPPEGGLLN